VNSPVAVVVGAGGVLGRALCEEFLAANYRVVGLRRGADPDPAAATRIVPCDLSNPLTTWRVMNTLVAELGRVDVAICNAAHLRIAPFADLSLADFDESWRAGVGTTFATARAVLPAMSARRTGALLISGATASLRGAARFSAFASAKFGLRGLAQSLAREYQPRGIHVAHVVLDGILRGSASATRFSSKDEDCMDARDIAHTYRLLAEQRANAWTHEIDLRPSSGRF
jgi:NAD(P)-dependent dehydrogenase (short-subunit alcohol dehydrogenase family)